MKLKGYLKPVILRILNRGDEKTGNEMSEEIEDIIGSKPSYGSIYPILQDLEEKNFVKTRREGKKKYYMLLEKGKGFVKELEEKKREHTENFLEMLRTFKTVFPDEDIDLLIESIENLEKDSERPQFPELLQIHHMLLTRSIEGREEEVREILKDALERLSDALEE